MTKPNLASRLFDGTFAEGEIEQQLDDLGLEFGKIGWDDYDNSLEIYDVPPDSRLSEEMQKFIHECGFTKCYVNHKDKWETHYSWKLGNFEPNKGWRVSYPHKSGHDEIRLEEEPPSSWKNFKYKICGKIK